MRTRWILLLICGCLAAATLYSIEGQSKTPPAIVEVPDFEYSFNKDEVFEESNEANLVSPYWWLDSGGKLLIQSGIGSTITGDLPSDDPWRRAYATTNPVDTDDGAHPQNVFRLVSRLEWDNPRVEAAFRIRRDNLSHSPNRRESNGLFVMSRYVDSDNLYYTGIRVDGHAVIKKKFAGVYYTLAEAVLYSGAYHRESAPSLLPHEEWIYLRSETTTDTNGTVRISLALREATSEEWRTVLATTDVGEDTPAITKSARIGLRTDFMDVEFGPILVDEL
ncbi:MAG: hypothetical protein AAB955_04125 [Patescibacteria group bacterium]